MRDSGSKEDEADTVYLLAKELAYDVVTGQTDKLTAALAKTSGKDFVQFAKAVEISAPKIDDKICRTKNVSGQPAKFGRYAEATDNESSSGENKVAVCGAAGGSNHSTAIAKAHVLKDFVRETLKGDGNGNWPMSRRVNGKTGEPTPKTNDNAEAVAKDIVKELTHEEKTIVAGLLAKTIEGGEVVEIRAVSSTSVMVNACYDLLSEGLGVVPYACVGLGGNFVGVVDGHITPKLAYRLKAGLSYQLSPEISAFAGGFYHRVVGDGVYDDLPAQRLVDDTSPAGRTKDTAIANFSMAYVGGEFGVRFAF
ncbi:P44/Msp2 family outer membrane protein [Anaplasma phagocytophilum str. Norway variant1]|uniref:P44/Msp2 family outer membrane protein n=1 Tax=Anaplasma phagocytophilum str. Norway variant1 TaxID=1392506 RepID=A0A7H9E035_ANAPH|nr:P44/Msp2 family outer membrane protein [Anaplasma phagocytophilum str. Norway variant1]